MKVAKFLLVAFIAVGLMACNNDDAPYVDVVEGAPATVSLLISTDMLSGTRAQGDLSLGANTDVTNTGIAAERAIHSLEVWLFDANGIVVGYGLFTDPVPDPTDGITTETFLNTGDGTYLALGIQTTSGARSMIAVANQSPAIGSANRNAVLGAITTDLRQAVWETPQGGTPGFSIGSGAGLVMTSEIVNIDLLPGHNFYGEEITEIDLTESNHISDQDNLLLTRINARIALVGLNLDFEDSDFDGFELTDVAMFNVRGESRLFPAAPAGNPPLLSGTNFLFGAPWPSVFASYVGYDIVADDAPNFVHNARLPHFPRTDANVNAGVVHTNLLVAPNTTAISRANAIFFYAFENAGDPLTPLLDEDDESVLDDEDNEIMHRANRTGTFIVLKGMLTGGAPARGEHTCDLGFTYYAIWVNDPQFSSSTNSATLDGSILRNTQYNITVNISGPGHPTIDPAQNTHLDVHVEVVPWVVVEQVVDWPNN